MYLESDVGPYFIFILFCSQRGVKKQNRRRNVLVYTAAGHHNRAEMLGFFCSFLEIRILWVFRLAPFCDWIETRARRAKNKISVFDDRTRSSEKRKKRKGRSLAICGRRTVRCCIAL